MTTMLTSSILLPARVAQSVINKSRSGKASNKPESTIVYRGVTREEPVVGVCLPSVRPCARVEHLVSKILSSSSQGCSCKASIPSLAKEKPVLGPPSVGDGSPSGSLGIRHGG